MTHKYFLTLAALALGLSAADAWSRDRDHRGHGFDRGHRHSGSGARHWAPRHHHSHWSRPYWVGPAYYWAGAPRWWYEPYPYFYAAPVYEPPVYVERVYEPVVVERVYERPREPRYVERSYAQAQPQPPRPMEPAQPPPPRAPRLERVTLSATELFEFDKATLKARQPRLDEIAEAMLRHREIDNVRITGHTDRIGSEAYNMKLSQRRADAVKAYLVAKGVAASRLQAVGRGEAQPVVQCSDQERAALIKCLEPNRRVEVEQITIEQRVTR
jgi:outer membrane protein OmpA-like peptidoglycan-associated protein